MPTVIEDDLRQSSDSLFPSDAILISSASSIRLHTELFSPRMPMPGDLDWNWIGRLSENHVLEEEQSSGSEGSEIADMEQVAERDFRVVLERVQSVLDGVEADEGYGGATRATEYAANRARDLISEAFAQMGNTFRRAAVTVSFDGGIRIQWIRPSSSVRAVIAPDEEADSYLYYEYGTEFDTEELTPDNVITRLSQLQS